MRRIPSRPTRRQVATNLAWLSGNAADLPAPAKPRKGGRQPEGLVNKAIAKWVGLRRDVLLWRNRRRVAEVAPGVRVLWGWGPTGASDWAGGYSFVIEPRHVGMRVLQVLVIEAKTDTGRVSEDQQKFIDHIIAAGGRAGVARNAEDAECLLR